MFDVSRGDRHQPCDYSALKSCRQMRLKMGLDHQSNLPYVLNLSIHEGWRHNRSFIYNCYHFLVYSIRQVQEEDRSNVLPPTLSCPTSSTTVTSHRKIIPCLLQSGTSHIRSSQVLSLIFSSLTFNITTHNIRPAPQIFPHPHSTHTMASTKAITTPISTLSPRLETQMGLLLDSVEQGGLEVEGRDSQVRQR